MSVETVARRYASALADVVIKTGEADSVKNELKSWNEMMSSNVELYEAFRNPSIPQNNKEKVLESLIQKTNPTPTTANFLRVLLRNSRLTEIGEINKRFASVLDERKGLGTAQITSARELTEAEKADIKANLEKLTNRTINLEYQVDKNIIGGVIARFGSTVYDGSVKTQLEELREKLIKK